MIVSMDTCTTIHKQRGKETIRMYEKILNVRRNLRITTLIVTLFPSLFNLCDAEERAGELTFNVRIDVSNKPAEVRLWLPCPVSDEDQTITDLNVRGNYVRKGTYREKKFGNSVLYTEWKHPREDAYVTVAFKIRRKEVVRKDAPSHGHTAIPKDVGTFLLPTSLCPVDGKVKEIAEEAAKGRETILAKARGIYDYLIDSMERDPKIVGCGAGDVLTLLETKKGKCVDFHSVYVGLARSVGVPAREIFGIRLPKGKEGVITGGYHCWAEVYIPQYGWIPVDPADVRKAALEKQVQNLDEIKELREYYFGAVDENRIRFGTGRDIVLNPKQKAGRLNYFMYPYAEIDGKPLDFLSQKTLKYEVTFREF